MSFKHRSSRTPLSPFLPLSNDERRAERLDSRSLSFCSPLPPPSSLLPFFFHSLSLPFVFVFPPPSLSLCLSLSVRFTSMLRGAHGFSRAACNSSGDLLRLIELWETRDENARRTSERGIVAYLVARRRHGGRLCVVLNTGRLFGCRGRRRWIGCTKKL